MKGLGRKLLWPGWGTALILAAASAGGLVWTFSGGREDSGWAYLFYALSAYALVIWWGRLPGLVRRGRAAVRRNALSARWLDDLPFRSGVTLRVSLAINGLFGAFQLAVGLWLHAWWELTLGCYYIVLGLARFLLLRGWAPGADPALERQKRRRCGWLLLALDVPLVGMAALVVVDGYGKSYPGYLIYVAALYTFYCVISGLVSLARCRRYQSPALSAGKTLSLANALVSLLSLQTAMFAAFGGEGTLVFRMNAATGGGVCAVIALLGLWSILAGRETGVSDPK